MDTSYKIRALLAMLIAVVAVVVPLARFINTRDWGVLLILPAPFFVYVLIRLGRMLERWVRGNSESGGRF